VCYRFGPCFPLVGPLPKDQGENPTNAKGITVTVRIDLARSRGRGPACRPRTPLTANPVTHASRREAALPPASRRRPYSGPVARRCENSAKEYKMSVSCWQVPITLCALHLATRRMMPLVTKIERSTCQATESTLLPVGSGETGPGSRVFTRARVAPAGPGPALAARPRARGPAKPRPQLLCRTLCQRQLLVGGRADAAPPPFPLGLSQAYSPPTAHQPSLHSPPRTAPLHSIHSLDTSGRPANHRGRAHPLRLTHCTSIGAPPCSCSYSRSCRRRALGFSVAASTCPPHGRAAYTPGRRDGTGPVRARLRTQRPGAPWN
jgi:hypothetical protein